LKIFDYNQYCYGYQPTAQKKGHQIVLRFGKISKKFLSKEIRANFCCRSLRRLLETVLKLLPEWKGSGFEDSQGSFFD
jgi:hypothetical protein